MKENDNVDYMMNNNKKRTLNTKKARIAILILSIFFLYIIYLLAKLVANPTATFIVEQGKIYKEETQEGYIIRDEQIIENDEQAGKIVQLKAEGKKVANGEAIYRFSLENENEINKKIEELDLKIQSALQQENTLFSTDIKLLETQIEEKLDNIYENTDVTEVEQYKKEITNAITKKAKIAGELTSSGSYVKQLIQERNQYETQLNSNSKYVYATKSGIISYKVDNLENTLTVGDFSYLNKEFLQSLNLKSGQIIASNNTEAKIINNFKCYIACTSKTEEAGSSAVGDSIKVRLPNSEEIPAKIVYKEKQNDNETLLVLEIKQSVENLVNYRKIAFDIVWWSDSGIKIPNSAIQYEGKFAYVIRNRAGYEEKILIKVLRQNDKYSIVDNYSTAELEEEGYDLSTLDSKKSISLYDEIIVKKR
ncbi:MAG: hypothetical protein IKD76_04885 [Clostridia bacterium]|nr:hypothetical protein [Clostridia bacterium]